MPLPRALAQFEIQTALSEIFTQVANSISYDNKVHNSYIYPTPPLGQDMTHGQSF